MGQVNFWSEVRRVLLSHLGHDVSFPSLLRVKYGLSLSSVRKLRKFLDDEQQRFKSLPDDLSNFIEGTLCAEGYPLLWEDLKDLPASDLLIDKVEASTLNQDCGRIERFGTRANLAFLMHLAAVPTTVDQYYAGYLQEDYKFLLAMLEINVISIPDNLICVNLVDASNRLDDLNALPKKR